MKTVEIVKSKIARRLLQTAFVLGSFLFLGQQIVSKWQDIQTAVIRLDWKIFAWSFLLLILSFLFRPAGLYFFSRKSSKRITYQDSGRAYFISQLMKYLPGGIWVYPSRVILLKRAGIDVSFSSLGLAFESIVMVSSCLLVGLGAASFLPEIPFINQELMFVLFIGFALATLAILALPEIVARYLPRIAVKGAWLSQIASIPFKMRLQSFFVTNVVYAAMWVVTGISFHYVLRSVNVDSTPLSPMLSIGAFSFSWAIGFISVFNPGGLGLREAVITLMLTPFITGPTPILAALLSRISWLFAEVLFFLISCFPFLGRKPIFHR